MQQKWFLEVIWKISSAYETFFVLNFIYLNQIPQTTEPMDNRLMKRNHNT